MELQMQVAEENLKPLVASLQCLSKIGKELSIECEGTLGMTFRTLNDAHSASAEINFEREFFENIRLVTPMGTRQLKGIPFIKSKVYTKYCCNMFRTLKNVRGLQITFLLGEINEDENGEDAEKEEEIEVECLEIVWKLLCDFEITKTHRMKVQECQIMRAVFDRDNAPNRIIGRQHHLSSLIQHMHSTNEVAVTCTQTHVKFESYFPTHHDGKPHLETETIVESSDFIRYRLKNASTPHGEESPVHLIFCLKELQSLLSFCSTCDLNEIHFYFIGGGNPVLFATEPNPSAPYYAEIVLSTIASFIPDSSQATSDADAIEQGQFPNISNRSPERDYSVQGEDQEDLEQQRYLTHRKKARTDEIP